MLTAILDEVDSLGVMTTNIRHHPHVTLISTSTGLGLEPDLVNLIQILDATLQTVQGLQNAVKILETKVEALESVNAELPIGTIIETNTSITNLDEIIHYGTWEMFGRGRVTVCSGIGFDVNDIEKQFFAFGTGGEYEHVLSKNELPALQFELEGSVAHEWIGNRNGVWRSDIPNIYPNSVEDNGSKAKTNSIGNNQAHNNMPPYIVVQRWVRVA